LGTGGVVRIEAVTPHVLRLRLKPDGEFPEPALVRYSILEQSGAAVECSVHEGPDAVAIATEGARLSIRRADGAFAFADAEGRALTESAGAPWSGPEGFGAELKLRDDERLYGLGDETRDRLNKRGHRARMWVRDVSCYVPIPFLMSTGGWGLFLNTTWRHYFDLGHAQADRLRFWGPRGELDLFLIAGETLPELLARYTGFAGRPTLLPRWGYGLTFVCNQQASAREMLDDALNLRRESLPCDLIGLEPGWMSRNYDFTTEKQWHPERFCIPEWAPTGDHTFGGALQRLGFKLSLWLCCDYDLSWEEERRAGTPLPLPGAAEADRDAAFEQDEHLSHPVLSDQVTRPGEPWFEHLKPFVDFGAAAFKMDGALQVIEHPDRRWANGMGDEEMHNLYPALLNKQMCLGFEEHTGRRSMIYSSGGYAGIQRYAATWAGDTGGGPGPLVSMLNHGLSGHVNASCDMDVFSPAGIHFGFLMPWSQVCSWAYWRHPWLLGDKLLPLYRFYAKLRYRLLPYLYSTAHLAHRTGMPIMRAMPLAFPDDPRSDELLHQYMLGEAFLTGAFIEELHLPAGTWLDFWTGDLYEGPQDLPVRFPEDRGGPLFVRAGAIIPLGSEMDYVGQRAEEELGLLIFPGGRSEFTVYEDDGVSLLYREGQVAETPVQCVAEPGRVEVTIGPRVGSYAGMSERRMYRLSVEAKQEPTVVELDGEHVEHGVWTYDERERIVRLEVEETGAARRVVLGALGTGNETRSGD
jgi:alpha-glucosidase (family GH31 glycosyl hydrolase)